MLNKRALRLSPELRIDLSFPALNLPFIRRRSDNSRVRSKPKRTALPADFAVGPFHLITCECVDAVTSTCVHGGELDANKFAETIRLCALLRGCVCVRVSEYK